MEFSYEEIENNWNVHIKIIEKFISSPRKEKLLALYDSIGDDLVIAPASGKHHYHNAIPGGYIDHVNNVVKCSLEIFNTWEKMGAPIDFTQEELIFTALVHDLGKVGEPGKSFYLKQDNQWRRDNLNEAYTNNKELDFMLIVDRTLYLLQSQGINLSFKEYLAIRTHDGLYEEVNKPYYVSYSPESKFRTNLPLILHQGDVLASTIEYQRWRDSNG